MQHNHHINSINSVSLNTLLDWNDDILNLYLWLSSIQQSNFINELQESLLLAPHLSMEESGDTNEPAGDEVETKEVDSETGDDRKEETVEKEVGEKKNKIEQRPFLTQSELLIKMKSGEEEEVKR